MTGWPDQPVICEINTAVWLGELSRAAERPVALASVGAADWDAAVLENHDEPRIASCVPADAEQATAAAIGWSDHQSCANPAAWSWAGDGHGNWHLVVVNLSGRPAQARIPLDWPDLPGRGWRLTDILGPSMFKRDGGELASPGLFVGLGPWHFHLVALQRPTTAGA
jgi:hypothetical protein